MQDLERRPAACSTLHESLCYLGSLLTASGSIAPELSKRIGAARAEFHTLKRIWAHSSLNMLKFYAGQVSTRFLRLYCTGRYCCWLGSLLFPLKT